MNSGDIIQFPPIRDDRGSLCFIEGGEHVPFEISRIFYLYDVPEGEWRGGHALKTCQQVCIAITGSFEVLIKDGVRESRHILNRTNQGLYLPPLVWRELGNFSPGAVCLVLASDPYDANAYYRDFEEFREAVRKLKWRSRFHSRI